MKPEEKEQLNDLLSKYKLCQVKTIEELDDGKTDIEYITEMVNWRCTAYTEQVKDLLYEDFNIDLGESWVYSNELRQKAPNEVTEAVLLRRKARSKLDDDEALFRKMQ